MHAIRRDPQAVAHPVEAGQIGGDLGRGDDVVGLQRVVGVRQVDLPHLGPGALQLPGYLSGHLAHAGVDPLVGELRYHADPQA